MKTHGEASKRHLTPEYVSWMTMRQRVRNSNNAVYKKDYIDRDITICARWESYENFLSDMGRKPGPGYSLERIDNDGGYSPNNCKWATPIEQQANRRNTLRATYKGVTKTITAWARQLGVHRNALYARLRTMPLEKALTLPRRNYPK